jgi:hypothetical protein
MTSLFTSKEKPSRVRKPDPISDPLRIQPDRNPRSRGCQAVGRDRPQCAWATGRVSDTPPVPPAIDPGRRGRLALAVAAAVDTVVGVRRSGGPGVEVATQYPGGRVVGVRLGGEQIVVHIIAERLPLQTVADAVHAAVGATLAGLGDRRAVAVRIDDLDV